MKTPLLKAELESALGQRFGWASKRGPRGIAPPAEKPHVTEPVNGQTLLTGKQQPHNADGRQFLSCGPQQHDASGAAADVGPRKRSLVCFLERNELAAHLCAASQLWADPALRRPAPETISTGVEEVDSLTGGLPRGAITEIFGPACSGRSSLLCSVLAAATARREICALVDVSDTLDPISAAQAGIELDRLLWIRCAARIHSGGVSQKRFSGHPVERALQVTDWLLQGGGFGVVALDLGDIPPATARRISLTSWFRLRRAIENTPTVLIVIGQEAQAKSCASLILETQRAKAVWAGSVCPARLLRGVVHRLECRKPVRSAAAAFEVGAVTAGLKAGLAG